MAVADVLSVLHIPQISYGASTILLKDMEKYPYFLRTVPADDKQVRIACNLYFHKNVSVKSCKVKKKYFCVASLDSWTRYHVIQLKININHKHSCDKSYKNTLLYILVNEMFRILLFFKNAKLN